MEKDIITVSLEDGTKKEMEVVLLYTDDISKINYILYKDMNENGECYAAKYVVNDNIFQLDSNLSNKEIMKLELVLNSSLRGNN